MKKIIYLMLLITCQLLYALEATISKEALEEDYLVEMLKHLQDDNPNQFKENYLQYKNALEAIENFDKNTCPLCKKLLTCYARTKRHFFNVCIQQNPLKSCYKLLFKVGNVTYTDSNQNKLSEQSNNRKDCTIFFDDNKPMWLR